MKADEKLFQSKVFTDFVVELLIYMNAPDSHQRIPFHDEIAQCSVSSRMQQKAGL